MSKNVFLIKAISKRCLKASFRTGIVKTLGNFPGAQLWWSPHFEDFESLFHAIVGVALQILGNITRLLLM